MYSPWKATLCGLYRESRKMVLINLFVRQEWRHRHREPTCGRSRGRRGCDKLREWYCHTCTAAATSLQSCPTLCDPIDGSPSGSPVPGILQARTLECGATAFSNAWKWKMKVKSLSHVRFTTSWTAAYQGPPSMGFSRQGYWSGMPLPSLRFLTSKIQIINIIHMSYTGTYLEEFMTQGRSC